MKHLVLAGCAALASGLAVSHAARAESDAPVAVAAGADDSYVREKFGGDSAKPKQESYVFVAGTFFGGYLRDASLESIAFTDIARVLAADLATQRYFPAADKRKADLLIVVHWGVTSVEEDASHGQMELDKLNKDLATYNSSLASKGVAEPGSVLSDLDFLDAKSGAGGTEMAGNAQLLGYTSELQKEEYRSLGVATGMTEMDRRLREDVADERYFVILMAYDFGSLKVGRTGAKPRLLWSDHVSVRAVGCNFAEVLPEMSRVAAPYFGRNVDGLLLDARKVPVGKVRIGETTSVGDGDPK